MTIPIIFDWFFISKIREFELGKFKHFKVPIYMYDFEHYRHDWGFILFVILKQKF
jgi:hypothetical protein